MGETFGQKFAEEMALRLTGYTDEGIERYHKHQEEVQAENDEILREYVDIAKDYAELAEDDSFDKGLQLVGSMYISYDIGSSQPKASSDFGPSMSGGGGSWESSGGGGVFDYSDGNAMPDAIMDAAGNSAKQIAIYGAGKGLESYSEYREEAYRREKELKDEGMSTFQARATIKAQSEREYRANAKQRNAKLKNAAKTAKTVNAQAKKIQSIGKFAKLFK